MKPTLSPANTAKLQQAINLVNQVYAAGWTELDSPYHMGRLSTAVGDLTFVMDSTRLHGAPQVWIIEREGVTR